MAIAEGVSRPGGLERRVAGISKKILSERLRKLTSYGLLDKQVFPEDTAEDRLFADIERPQTDHYHRSDKIPGCSNGQ